MKYLQIVATGILIMLCIIAIQLRALRQPTNGDLKRAYTNGDETSIERFHESLPITDVRSVADDVSVIGTVDVNVKYPVEVRTDYKNPLKVEVEP
jgi:hypothetical protein